jgi:hypothetical protein
MSVYVGRADTIEKFQSRHKRVVFAGDRHSYVQLDRIGGERAAAPARGIPGTTEGLSYGRYCRSLVGIL